MRIEQLEYILATAEVKSISAAARKCYVQQTTFSSAIKTAEDELDIQIFSRMHNGVELTSDGNRVLPFIREIVSTWQRLKEQTRETSEKFIIYAHSHACDNYAMEILRQTNERLTGVPISVVDYSAPTLIEYLATNSEAVAGIGICSMEELPYYHKQAISSNLIMESLCLMQVKLYVRSDSPYAQRSSVNIRELANEHLVFESGDLERYYLDQLDKFIPKYSMVSSSHLVRLAVLNCGYIGLTCDVSILPRCRTFPPPSRLKMLDVVGIPEQSVEHYFLVYPSNCQFNAKKKALLDCIRDSFPQKPNASFSTDTEEMMM